MTVNPTLLAMLACPSDDHAPLREESQGGVDTLVCTYCATRYPVDDGIPVLLLDDATPGPNGVGVAAAPVEVLPVEVVVAAEPVPAAVDVQPLTVAAIKGDYPADDRLSPKHALPERADPVEAVAADQVEPEEFAQEEIETVEVIDVADVVEVADVLGPDDVIQDEPVAEDEPAATDPATPPASLPGDPRRPQTAPPGARSLTAGLRNRVQHRLAELEASRGPRRRRGSGR